MNRYWIRAIVLSAALALASAATATARVPAPAALPTPPQPTVPLHTAFNVEVNHLGQVVLVKSGTSSKNLTFNAQTYGNVLQMWIRRQDGTAVVGMYRVTYDYNPKTHGITRSVKLLWAGGDWGNQEGAANQMLDVMKRRQEAARRKEERNLPDINAAIRKALAAPAPSATPQP